MQLKNTKGALFFREDRGVGNDRVLRLCVVLKRKLLIYIWQNHEFKEVKVRILHFTCFELNFVMDIVCCVQELSVQRSVKAVAWCTPDKLCVGFQKEYSFIQISSGVISNIELAGGGITTPLILPVPSQQLILQRDSLYSLSSFSFSFFRSHFPLTHNSVVFESIQIQVSL
jgi:hypothetical protein